jgi:hypothetical protein
MALLGETSITHRRFAAGAWDGEGEYVSGAATDTSMLASVQVATGRDLQILPAGKRTRETIKVYTEDATTGFRSADQRNQVAADHLVVASVVYEVQHVYPEHPLITHSKCLATRLQEVDGSA